MFIQTFITQTYNERSEIGILIGLARLNQSQGDLIQMRPGQHRAFAKLRSVVGTNHLWQTTSDSQTILNSVQRVKAPE